MPCLAEVEAVLRALQSVSANAKCWASFTFKVNVKYRIIDFVVHELAHLPSLFRIE